MVVVVVGEKGGVVAGGEEEEVGTGVVEEMSGLVRAGSWEGCLGIGGCGCAVHNRDAVEKHERCGRAIARGATSGRSSGMNVREQDIVCTVCWRKLRGTVL